VGTAGGEAAPRLSIEELRQFGMFSLIVPEEFGGMGMNATSYFAVRCRIDRQVRRPRVGGVTVRARTAASGMRGLLLFGTDEQKKKWDAEAGDGRG